MPICLKSPGLEHPVLTSLSLVPYLRPGGKPPGAFFVFERRGYGGSREAFSAIPETPSRRSSSVRTSPRAMSLAASITSRW